MKLIIENRNNRLGSRVKSITHEAKDDGSITKKVAKKGLAGLVPNKTVLQKDETGPGYTETPTSATKVAQAIANIAKAHPADSGLTFEDRTFSEEERARLPSAKSRDPGAFSSTSSVIFQKRLERDRQRLRDAATPQERARLARQINQWQSWLDGAETAYEERKKLPSAMERVSGLMTGAAKQSAGAAASGTGTLLDAVRHFDAAGSTYRQRAAQEQENAAHLRKMLQRGTLDDGTVIDPEEHRRLEQMVKQAENRVKIYTQANVDQHRPISGVIDSTYTKADQLSDSGAADVERAKQGLGKLGQFAVDTGVAGTQMAIDTAIGLALSPITGGVSLMAPMAARSFGGAAQEARRSGGDLARQLAYGTGSAALSVFTENLFNPIEGKPGIFGKGILNKQMNALFGEFGNTAPGVIAKSALEEGLEEVAESAGQDIVLKPLTLGEKPSFHPKDAAYQGAIGAVLGGLGGGVEAARRSQPPPPLQNFNAVQDPESRPTQQTGQNVEPIVQAIQTVAQQQDAARQAAVQAAANAARQTSAQPGAEAAPTVQEPVQTEEKTPAPPLETPVNENGLIALSELERTNLSSGKKNKIISTFKDAVAFIRNALTNKQSVEKAYLGKIPDIVAKSVLEQTGMDISQYHAILQSDNIRHIIKKHGDPVIETARGQRAVTAEDIAALPKVLSTPDKISLSPERDRRGRAVLIFEKDMGDHYITMQAVTNGNHSIQTDTIYIRKKKNSQGTEYYDASVSTDPAHNAQSVPPQSSSFDPTIQQSEPEVKSAEQVELLTRKPVQQELDPLVLAIQRLASGNLEAALPRLPAPRLEIPPVQQTQQVQSPPQPDAPVVQEPVQAETPSAEEPVYRAGRVTTIQHPYQGKVPVQTQKSADPVVVDSSSVQTAQNRINGAAELEKMHLASLRSILKRGIKETFKPVSGIVVDGMSFDGKPYKVDIGRKVVGKVVNDPHLTAEKLALLDRLPDVVKHGEYVGSSAYIAHGSKAKDTVRFDFFETPVIIAGKSYIAKFDVEVFPSRNNYRTHQIVEMDLSAPEGRLVGNDKGPTPTPGGTNPSDATITQPPAAVKEEAPAQTDVPPEQTAESPAPSTEDDSLGAARAGFTTNAKKLRGEENTSRMAEQFPYNESQAQATGLSAEDYNRIFRYESMKEDKSRTLAEEQVYMMKDGKRTFLKDINEASYQALTGSLRDATAWNAPQMDAAQMILMELWGRAYNGDVESSEYTEWLNTVREHETAGGQGIQAVNKWMASENDSGLHSRGDALRNLQKSGLSEEEQHRRFHRIVLFDSQIEAVKSGDSAAMKRIILDIAQERGVLTGMFGIFKNQTRLGRRFTEWKLNRCMDALTFDELKQFAYQSSAALSTDAIRADIGQMAKTFQVLNMLSSFKTPGRNLGGNGVFYPMDAVSMDGAALLDMALSQLTGTRSVAMEKFVLSRSVRDSIRKNASMSILECALDVDMSGEGGKYGSGSRRTFHSDGNAISRFLSAMERNQAYLLTVPDEAFKGAYRASAGQTQKLIDQGKIRTTNSNYAVEQAEQLAKYRTFQDNSPLAAAMQGIHDVCNLIPLKFLGDSGKTIAGHTVTNFGLGDIVVSPFVRVSANLASRVIGYSPVSAAVGSLEMLNLIYQAKVRHRTIDPKRQARAVSHTARGLTGSALIGVFCMALASGLIRREEDENNQNVAALNRSEGIHGVQINLSAMKRWINGGDVEWQNQDRLLNIAELEPLNGLLNIAAEIVNDENPTAASLAQDNLMGMLYAAGELPVMQSSANPAKRIIKYGEDPLTVFGEEYGRTLAASTTPNLIAALAKGLDDRPRSTSGDTPLDVILNTYKSRLPVARNTLPGSVNPTGEEKLYQGSGADRFIDAMFTPFSVSSYDQSEVSREMQRVREATGETGFYPSSRIPKTLKYGGEDDEDRKEVELTYQERQDFQRDRGGLIMIHTANMLGSNYYKAANPKQQADLLTDIHTFAHSATKLDFLGADSLANHDKWVQKALDAQQATGLRPVDFINYRDMLSRAEKEAKEDEEKSVADANAAVREAIYADSSLTAAQKTALDDAIIDDTTIIPKDLKVDYSDRDAYIVTQMSDPAQKHWPQVHDRFGFDGETFQQVWSICKSKDYKAAEKRQMLNDMGLDGPAVYKFISKLSKSS